MTIDDLGQRICIMGPSGSGKSTLANAIARSKGLPPVHLDQLRHLPNTDWVMRPEAEFAALHDVAILAPAWVIDGNYARYLPQRLARATGLILIDVSTIVSLGRYFRRSWFEHDRRGGLAGDKDSVKWEMIRHITTTSRTNRKRYRQIFDALDLPKASLVGTQALADFYRAQGLRR